MATTLKGKQREARSRGPGDLRSRFVAWGFALPRLVVKLFFFFQRGCEELSRRHCSFVSAGASIMKRQRPRFLTMAYY